MAIARVSVLEFDSAEALAFAQESHKRQRAKVFPHMQMCLCIRTSPTSFVASLYILARKLQKPIWKIGLNSMKKYLVLL